MSDGEAVSYLSTKAAIRVLFSTKRIPNARGFFQDIEGTTWGTKGTTSDQNGSRYLSYEMPSDGGKSGHTWEPACGR
jgi:hypothetical protein